MRKLRGVLPVVPTPFAETGEPDLEALRRLVATAAAEDAAALVYPGVASEDVHLSTEERRECLKTVIDAAAGRLPVVAGINSADPEECVALAGAVAGAGADALMAMAVPAMGDDVVAWFVRIEEAAGGRPIILQNLFRPRGADLTAAAMLELAREIPSIRYVKEEGIPSGPKVSELVAGAGADLDGVIGGGGARYLFEELERGATATMPALELLSTHVALMAAWSDGRRGDALALYERTLPLLLIQAPYRMRMTKHILKRRGLIADDGVREPLPELDATTRRLIDELYDRAVAQEAALV